MAAGHAAPMARHAVELVRRRVAGGGPDDPGPEAELLAGRLHGRVQLLVVHAAEVEPLDVEDEHVRLAPDLELLHGVHHLVALLARHAVAVLHLHLLGLREGVDAGADRHPRLAGRHRLPAVDAHGPLEASGVRLLRVGGVRPGHGGVVGHGVHVVLVVDRRVHPVQREVDLGGAHRARQEPGPQPQPGAALGEEAPRAVPAVAGAAGSAGGVHDPRDEGHLPFLGRRGGVVPALPLAARWPQEPPRVQHEHVVQRGVAPRGRRAHDEGQAEDLAALRPGPAVGAADVHHPAVHRLDEKHAGLRLLLDVLRPLPALPGRRVALLVLHELLRRLKHLEGKKLVLRAHVRKGKAGVQVAVNSTAVDLRQEHRGHGHGQPAGQRALHPLHRAALRHSDGVAGERLALVAPRARVGQWEEDHPQGGAVDVV
mmetsp:Transcript_97280/g.314126  ORF Transcript_97280/g.314126 Transcript_97280/m.314126 type:complete len:427 (-) Transcript_97280:1078-2358(-)